MFGFVRKVLGVSHQSRATSAREGDTTPFHQLAAQWLAERPLRDSWRREVSRLLGKELAALGPHPTRGEVASLLRGITAPSVHNHCLAILGAVYRWGIATGRVEINPAAGFRRRPIPARERVLSENELARVWGACGNDDHGRIVKLLILTGSRCNEIAGLQWDEVDWAKGQIILPGTRTKNRKPHVIPLSHLALGLLLPKRIGYPNVFGRCRGKGFNGWSKGKAELDARCGVREWTLHDLRRTAVTIWNERRLGDPALIELAVNHISGHKSGVAGIYNRSERLAERRELLEKWSKEVPRLGAECNASVSDRAPVPLLSPPRSSATGIEYPDL